MTIKELIDDLSRFPDDARVVFTPEEYCGSGYPEWKGAFAGGDDLDQTGVVIVTLTGELE